MNRLFLMIFIIAGCSRSAEYTDMAEFGIKGQPKIVVTCVYENFHVLNGEWVPTNAEDFVSYFEMKVNEKGMITEIIHREFSPETGKKEETRTVFTFKDGRKSSGRIYDVNWKINEFFTCHWIDDNTYETHGFSYEGNLKFTQKIFLDMNYRDQSGQFTYYDPASGKIMFNEFYTNEFDQHGNIIASTSENQSKNEDGKFISSSLSVKYEKLSADNFGNTLNSLMYESGNKDTERLIVRKIMYFE